MEYAVGDYYDVPCAELRWKEDGRIYVVPVLDHLHADPEFGFPHEHYHIDGRFELHPRLQHWMKVQDGHTLAVIVKHDEGAYQFLGIVPQRLRCERLETGLTFSPEPTEKQAVNLTAYREWYAGFVGRECKGRRCPHYGTEMLERDGLLVCPMHELTADAGTLKIIDCRAP